MECKQCFLTKNTCYLRNIRRKPTGIVVHSTGANNPSLSRYVQPDDGLLGANRYGNDWNRAGLSVCVNAFIGKDKNGAVRVYQTLPWDMRPWGCGAGSKGSCNDTHVQFEICEDDLSNKSYFDAVYAAAVALCVMLCREYGIDVKNVVDHAEACAQGYATPHGDISHWLKRYEKSLRDFRADVEKGLRGKAPAEKPAHAPSLPTRSVTMKQDITAKSGVTLFAACAAGNVLNVRSAASTSSPVKKTLVKNDPVKWYGYFTSDHQWYYVQCADGTTGYVSNQYLRRVKV